MEPLVTIVVPVYNTEKTIDRCLESIVNQTYKKLEIIIIDDGSSDNSPQICEGWKERDSRISVIHKQNQGLGMARNTGIENLKGDYFCFCDSDDYLKTNLVETCVKIVNKENVDLVHYGMDILDNKLNIKKEIKAKQSKTFVGEKVKNEFVEQMLNGEIGLWTSLCTSFISSKCVKLQGWKSESERVIISEDMSSLLDLYSIINGVYITTDILYHYCENQKSLSHLYRPDRYEKIKKFYHYCCEKCNKLQYNSKIKKCIARFYVSYTISAVKQIIFEKMTKEEKYNQLRIVSSDEDLQNIFSLELRKKYILKQKIFMICMLKGWLKMVYIFCILNETL